jgi:Peptidase family M28
VPIQHGSRARALTILCGMLSAACATRPAPRAPAAAVGVEEPRVAPSVPAALRPLSPEERALEHELAHEVRELAGKIGERNVKQKWELASAADYLALAFEDAGYSVNRQGLVMEGVAPMNIEVTVRGGLRGDEIVIVGAHYDSAEGSPGANDDASGAAAVLALARAYRHARPSRTLRFVEFVNAEPPYFQTEHMGSLAYAKRAAARGEQVVAMLSIDDIGCFSDAPKSQRAPAGFAATYPTTGNFVAFLSKTEFAPLVDSAVLAFRSRVSLPVEGTPLPEAQSSVSWSDPWAFWQVGFPALMVTDTTALRDPRYRTAGDTPDKLDYDRMARVVSGLEAVVDRLAQVPYGAGAAPPSTALAPR